MSLRRILTGGFFLLAGVAGYVTWLTWRAEDSAKWLFLVFTLIFFALGGAALRPTTNRPPAPVAAAPTRFVPHWFMMLALIVLALTVLGAIVGIVVHH